MIVSDASAALAALLHAGQARDEWGEEQVHVPYLVDSEVASGLRRQVTTGRMSDGDAEAALGTWQSLGMTRHGANSLMDRIWELRHNLSVYDATYVALAEVLGCTLLSADGQLGRAPGIRCPVKVVPR